MGMHWYSQQGTPAYSMVGANGKERDVTLRDARKLGHVPSVTTVLEVLAKPGLETWKVQQGILAALTLPRIEGEDEDVYLSRVMTDSREQAKKAAEEGTRIHDAIECSFKGHRIPDGYREHVEATRKKIAELFPNVTDWIAEESFAHPSGYGGKVDLHSPSTGIVIDYKGKDGDFSDKKKLAYDQHYQLAGYQYGLYLPPNVCVNLFVSRTHPGCVAEHVWSVEEIEEGAQVFKAALALWKSVKKYDGAFMHALAA
jgi:hypothetical protein